jgi:hypothetical protein
MRMKFQDAPGKVVRAGDSTTDGNHCGYPADYPLNGGADAFDEQSATLVGRWHSTMFEARQVGDSIEIWRKPDQVTSADVRDAAARNDVAGLTALNQLHRKHYGDQ